MTTQLTEVRAADLMQTEVVQLAGDAPIEEAIRTFEEYNIRGAPVVDGSGRLIGVLSANDITRSDRVGDGRLDTDGYELADEDEDGDTTFSDGFSPTVGGRPTVADWMRHGILSVKPEASLKEVCEVMERESIHRVLVTEGGQLKGLISAFDVVRYLAQTL